MKILIILLVLVEVLSLVAGISGSSDIKKDETITFVTDQFNHWMGASNCTAFQDSFNETFKYCDGPGGCTDSKKKIGLKCDTGGKITGEYFSLVVKPSTWTGLMPDYSDIAITGRQDLLEDNACADFAILEKLSRADSGNLISSSWIGYYVITPGS
eukprot:scaffold68321_cov41-Attheya_sp.AAC.1